MFNSFGGATKKIERHPEEILIFCVDCSSSMGQPSDFDELKNENENSPGSEGLSYDSELDKLEQYQIPNYNLGQMKGLFRLPWSCPLLS